MELRRFLAAFVPCLLTITAALAGDIYSWRDAEGHVHYSDAPPAGSVDVQKRRTRISADTPDAASSAKPATLAEKDLEFRKRRAETADADAKAAKDKADAAQRQDDCKNMRNHIATLESGQRVARTNDKGEREFIDDSQRQADLERMRKQIEQGCK